MLFKDTQKLQEFAEITSGVNFASVKATLDRIEQSHILPVLGATLFNSLNNAYTSASNETSLSAAQKSLLQQCRKVIGAFLGYYYAPLAELKLSDAGLRREETNSSKTAFQYQVTNYREACLRNGEAATELLYEFLETNKADYSDWTNSDAFKSYRSLFIKSGKEFNELFPSHSPYRNYYAMRSKMQDVEEQNIRAALGDATFDALKTKDRATNPGFSDKEKILLFKLKKAIANFTVSFAIPLLAVRIDANGITVVNSGPRTSRDEDAARASAAAENFSNLITATADAGNAWLKDSIKYLNENAADFATWTAETTTTSPDNNPDLNASFILL